METENKTAPLKEKGLFITIRFPWDVRIGHAAPRLSVRVESLSKRAVNAQLELRLN
jgi:hypothetical protein